MARFHVFLSYNRADQIVVEQLARKLEADGIITWFDKWRLIPGEQWMPAIGRALDESDSCAIFFGPSGTGSFQNEEIQASIELRVNNRDGGFRVIPVLLPGATREKRSKLPPFISSATWVEFHETTDDENVYNLLKSGIRGEEPGPGPGQALFQGECPYRGLEFFDVEHARFYFGREALLGWALDAIRPSAPKQSQTRFLALIGCSGSGKSSFARAGVVAALSGDRPESPRWPYVICRPGPNPIESLSFALAERLGFSKDPVRLLELADKLKTADSTLHVSSKAIAGNPEARLVVLIDQFEECFTLCTDEDIQRAFFKNLTNAIAVPHGPTLILITLRADFYANCTRFPELAAALSDSQLLVGPMLDVELRRIIELPGRLAGIDFERGLVDVLVEDVRNEPSCLPLLQFTLRELWRTSRPVFTHAGYQQMGRVAGALAKRAEELFQHLPDSSREILRHILLRLVQHAGATRYVRRRIPISEVVTPRVKLEDARHLMFELSTKDTRLLTLEADLKPAPTEFVEMAHEALIESWPRFHDWLKEDQEFHLWQERLRVSLENWRHANRHDSALLRGPLLDEAIRWLESNAGDLNLEEQEFITASAALRDRENAAEQRRRLELEREQRARLEAESARAEAETRRAEQETLRADREHKLAEEERRTAQEQKKAARNLKRFVAALAIGVLATLVLAAVVYFEWRDAYAREIAATATSNFEPSDKRLGLALALYGVKEKEMPETVQALSDAVQFAGGPAMDRPKPDDGAATSPPKNPAVTAIAFSPDGKRALTAGSDGAVRMWEAKTSYVYEELPGTPVSTGATNLAFAHSGRLVAIGLRDKTVSLLASPDMTVRHMTPPYPSAIQSVDFSADDSIVAAALWSGTVNLLDQAGNASGAPLAIAQNIRQAVFNWDGSRLGVALVNGAAQIWNMKTRRAEMTLTHGGNSVVVTSVAFSRDGKRIATAGLDKQVKVWDAKSGKQVKALTDTGDLSRVLFSPDSKYLVTTSVEQGAKLWDIESGQTLRQLGSDQLICAAFTNMAGPARVAFGSRSGTVRIYDLDIAALIGRARGTLQSLPKTTLSDDECRRYLQKGRCPAL
jgi:hypothetical protein